MAIAHIRSGNRGRLTGIVNGMLFADKTIGELRTSSNTSEMATSAYNTMTGDNDDLAGDGT